jgi:threonine synthase
MDEKGNITKEPDTRKLHDDIFAVSVRDTETTDAIKEVYKKYKIILEPHGAAGWMGLQKYLGQFPDEKSALTVMFETAHPAKFPEAIRNLLNIEPVLPPSLKGLDKLDESYDKIGNTYEQFKEYLMSRY